VHSIVVPVPVMDGAERRITRRMHGIVIFMAAFAGKRAC
jgi:hypothetical protein